MSGYNKRAGIFELTSTKAGYWLRREDISEDCIKLKESPFSNGMQFYACLLEKHGLEVIHIDTAFLRVKATPGQVWEALSGEPSDPEREKHYLQ